MCNKAVDKYPHALKFVSECYMILKKMFDKVNDTVKLSICYISIKLLIKFVPECYKTQKKV